IPFFDMGGILADNEVISSALLKEAVTLGRSLKVDTIELREREKKESGVRSQESEEEQDSRVQGFEGSRENTPHVTTNLTNSTNKVRMILALPGSSEELMASFKSKLRSQIKRPIKDGLTATIGGLELLDPFYSVFCVNMRDLGSPVHSRKLIETVLSVFSETAKIVMVYKNNTPIAGSIIIGFKDILENPWASSLKAYSHLSPNMLLYWTMLEYACDKGFRFFDFGRSTPGEGTFQFKKQWGSESSPLHWHTIYLNGQQEENDSFTEKNKFSRAIKYWQKLPVPLTRALGPIVRKNISL
ncbi:MAG: GNAT family N-acetyltransferase, partial [Desulfobacterium sp.]|nr:GNAT family N-acetyltransferase [Desulfobacterium sp.]